MREIIISNKKYKIDCNGITYIQFKKIFNRSIFEDLNIIKNYIMLQKIEVEKIKEELPHIKDDEAIFLTAGLMQTQVDEFVEAITRIAYISIYTADNSIVSYEDWLKNISKINLDDDWIVEVAEFAVDCFC